MDVQTGIVPSYAKLKLIRETYGFSLVDGVEFPVADSMILSLPTGEVSIYLKTFDAGLRHPLTNFQEELLQKNGCNIHMLTSDAVNKMMEFEMICWTNGVPPNFFIFKFFLWFNATDDKYTFSARRSGHVLVPDRKNPKNWQEKWLWVN